MSFGTGFHDIKIIETCLNEGAQFLHEYREYLKDIFQVEKDYVKNNLSIISKYRARQEKRYTLSELTTSHRAWIVFLGNMEKKCDERIALLDKYNAEVVEPLKIIIAKEEDKKKKQISFYKKLSTFVERYCQENEKSSIKYHESCDAVMNSKKKSDKKQDKIDKSLNKSSDTDSIEKPNLTVSTTNINTCHLQTPSVPLSAIHSSIGNLNNNYLLNDDGDDDDVPNNVNDKKKMKKGKKILNPLIKMNNKKNFYLLSLKVANALKNKFYEEDTPYIFDELQSINEEMYQNFKEICSRQIEYEKELFNTFNEKNDEILRSLNSINVSKDSTIYLRCYSKEWTKPEPIPFIPTTHWEDKEELVVDSQTSVVLKNMVQKGNERMYKINLDINSKTSEYKKFEMICNSYDNNSNYSKGEIDIIKNKKMDIMENIIMATNIKLICEVQINEISKYLGNNGPKVERQHVFKPKKIINPTICDYCKEKLWGKAYTCQLCTFSCHIKCEIKVPLECNGVKTKRKSLRINCSQLSDGKHNISSPFIKTSKPFNGVNNITKIKEEDEENESGISDDERVKSELGETSEKALTKYTEKGEISKSALNKNLETPDDKITNPFSFNIKELLWYIDNNEFPSITADSLVDMPTISELIKKNSTIADDIEILQLRQQRHSLDSSSDSNELKNDNNNNKIRKSLTMNSIDNVIYNNISPSSSQYYNAHTGSSTVDSSDGFRNSLNGNNIGDNNIRNNEVDGNESISIIETNEISPSISNDIITEDENDITSNGISNDNSMENTSSDEIYEEVPMKEMNNLEIYKLNPDVRLNQISNNTSTYQFPKSKSLPMLYSSFDSDEEEEENEERKEKMAIERRNSYLREKFYLKNNINRPHDENFIKMIAMYDYQRQSDDELDLSSNEEVTLIIPDDGSGWAMVSSNKGCGLVPANYLMECAKVIKDYIPNENEPDKLQVKLGDVLLIIEKDNGSGYTRARIKDKEGLIPSTLIEPIS